MLAQLLIFCLVFTTFSQQLIAASPITPTKNEMQAIAKKIWLNECAGTIAGLTSWNQGEDFASMGIGHFIWYPFEKKSQNQSTTFAETFPSLLVFFNQKNIPLPRWLFHPVNGPAPCPWNSRNEFLASISHPKMEELRLLLNETIALQAEFMGIRLTKALPSMLKSLAENRRPLVEERFYRIAAEPMGLYVLIDYLNFKGEGTKPTESYAGYRWGLLQVLDEMNASSSESAIEQFAVSARQVLQRRVANSPKERNEARWLKGWLNRIDTYTEERIKVGFIALRKPWD